MMLHTARPQTVGGDQADDGSSKPPPMPNYHMVIHPEAHTRKEKRKTNSNSKWWTGMFSCLNCAGNANDERIWIVASHFSQELSSRLVASTMVDV